MGIQISGLLSNQAFDWKSIVDQLVAADGIPIKGLQTDQQTNTDKITALTDINTALQSLQDSAQAIRANNPFQNRAVSSDNSTSTWKATSTAGAPLGTYKITVQTLATASRLTGNSHIGADLNSTSADLSGLTVGSLPTATQVTAPDTSAETFTVNGQKITFASTDSLKSVLDQITSATSGDVTWSYSGDKITLHSLSGAPMVMGAANDTSNFLAVMKLSSSSTDTTTSSGSLGTAALTAKLNSGRFANAISGSAVDTNGNGSFTINGKSITYNVNDDTLNEVLSRINSSDAGVTASYDSSNDRVVLTSKKTGFMNLNVSDVSGGFLDAVGLTSGGVQSPTTTYGSDAKYSLDGGTNWIYSASNTLDSSSHGIAGFSVTVNSTGTESLTVAADTGSMNTSIQDFIDKFNAVQDLIEEKTKITKGSGTDVTTSVLSGNHEVEDWATQLQRLAFQTVTGITGSITHLDDLGIDFDGTTGHLAIKDAGKLNTALENKPDDVQAYFMSGSNGLVPTIYNALIGLTSADRTQQANISKTNTDLTDQIAALQTRLDQERETLTNSFIRMLDAQSAAQSQNTAITNAFFKNSSN